MKIKFPLLILGYSPSKVFSTEDKDGRICFPVFYDPEKAEAYRRFLAREFQQILEVYVIESARQGLPFFQFLLMADPELQDIVIDPPPPVEGKKGGQSVQYWQFLESLQSHCENQSRRRHRRRRGGNHRQTRTK